MITFQALWDRQAAWSERTFGTERGPVGPLRHLLRELEEVASASPADAVLEWADVLILAIDATRRAGFSDARCFAPGVEPPAESISAHARVLIDHALCGEFPTALFGQLITGVFDSAPDFAYDDLIAAAYVKVLINERRTWSAPDAEGVVEHVRAPEWTENPQPLELPAESVLRMQELIDDAGPPDTMPAQRNHGTEQREGRVYTHAECAVMWPNGSGGRTSED